MKTLITTASILTLTTALTTTAEAQIALNGYFIAHSECPVYQSIRNQTNTGGVMTEIDHAYDLLGKNKNQATHYLIKLQSNGSQRWVAVECGEHVIPFVQWADEAEATNNETQESETQQKPPSSSNQHYLLAVSWQPGFCETRPAKPECVSQTSERFDASHFTLHGLWPQPRSNIYCNATTDLISTDKNSNWQALPALKLQKETRTELETVMPGSQSFLQRHEWIKHGTCYNDQSAEHYYRDSLKLMRELNSSKVRSLFADHIGKEITATQITTAFNQAFGNGAGEKIKITCKDDDKRRLITEITIGLQGDLGQLGLADAIKNAPKANNPGCNKGIVDPAGFQ